MKAIPLAIPDVMLIEPQVFHDERGFFFESFNQVRFEQQIGRPVQFVQDNHAQSSQGVLRGLHYQTAPYEQGKLIRVVQGEIFDVAVDIRKNSPTFGRWVGKIISAENKQQIWIPEGFAHGYITLSATSSVIYKATNHYSPQHEYCILWNDPTLKIDWPIIEKPIMSKKDQQGQTLYK